MSANEGEEAVRGLRRYRALEELELPLILLVGGATGTGKSTVTTEVAHRLGITRVASTDFVRQTMRAFFSEGFMPSIHYSSFEAAAAVAAPEEARDPTVIGFTDQTRNVLVGVRAVIDRALTEGYSVALEGVHIVPGLVPSEKEGAVVVQVLLTIDDEDEHARHFWVRDAISEGVRPVEKYLDALGDIRRIQSHLVERAEQVGRAGLRELAHRPHRRGDHPARARGGRAVGRSGGAGVSQIEDDGVFCPCELFAATTERAALAGGRWLGRGDVRAAEEASVTGMAEALDALAIEGHIVVGADDDRGVLEIGTTIGQGGRAYDLAVDPLEGRSVVARGDYGAMAMIAVGDKGAFPLLPNTYMRKMAVGPVARGRIDLNGPVGDNVRAIAAAFGRNTNDITAIVLDRPRHHDLIEEIRTAGARIKLIQDGDVTASITAAIRGTNDHLAIGIGGARQALMAAAALRCLGGELQAQLWPTTRSEIEEAHEYGIDDVERLFRTKDLAPGHVIVAATGVSNSDLLRGVRYLADSARTHTVVMCTRHNWVRFIDGIHFFARERREEVRLLG